MPEICAALEARWKKAVCPAVFVSSHPGSTMMDGNGFQSLSGTRASAGTGAGLLSDPGTLATCMYYTGLDPETGKKVYVAKKVRKKNRCRRIIQYKNPKNHRIVKSASESRA